MRYLLWFLTIISTLYGGFLFLDGLATANGAPQSGQASTSRPKVRRKSSAQAT